VINVIKYINLERDCGDIIKYAQEYAAQEYAAQEYAAQEYAAQEYAAQEYAAQEYAAQEYAEQILYPPNIILVKKNSCTI
jgi:hypothetical protein